VTGKKVREQEKTAARHNGDDDRKRKKTMIKNEVVLKTLGRNSNRRWENAAHCGPSEKEREEKEERKCAWRELSRQDNASGTNASWKVGLRLHLKARRKRRDTLGGKFQLVRTCER